MRSESNAQKWLDHVEAWKKSSISQSEYCRLNKLCVKSFSNWKLKLARKPQETPTVSDADIPVFKSSPSPVPLIPVAISEQVESATTAETITQDLPSSDSSGITLVFRNDFQISLAIGFHPSTLKNLLQVLAK